VSKGTLDGGHGLLAYHYGKQNALALWGSGPAGGMDANMVACVAQIGGGKQLLVKSISHRANVVSFPYGPMATQPLAGQKRITKADDFKGMKYRTVGLSIDIFTGLGRGGERVARRRNCAAMTALAGRGGVQQRASDRVLGFPRLQDLHVAELPTVRRAARDHIQQAKYDALPEK